MKKTSPLFLPSVLLLLSFFVVLASGCKPQAIDLTYSGGDVAAKPYQVFDGVLNAQSVAFRYEAGQYRCGTPDGLNSNLVFYFDALTDGTYQPVMNTDLSQATCINYEYTLVRTEQTTVFLVSNG